MISYMKAFPVVTDRRFYSRMLTLAIPLILQHFLRVSVDMADSLMLGRIDQTQMSAISQAQQVFFIYYTLCNGFSAGCSVLVAQYWGRKDKERIKTIFAVGLRTIILFSLPVSALVITLPQLFMRVYSNDTAIVELGASYLRIAACMYLPCAVSTMLFACCRGIEQVQIAFTANAISYPLNLLLDYCLIFGKFGFPEMGIRGAAAGALTARLAECLILVCYVFGKESRICMSFRDLIRRDRSLLRKFAVVAFPIVTHELIWSAGTSAASAITGQMGAHVVGGYNVAYVLYQLLSCVMQGILPVCSIVIGSAIGACESRGEIKKQADSMLMIGGITGVLLGAVMLLTGGLFTGLYSLTDSARYYARCFIAVLACVWPFTGMEMTGMIATLRAGGDGKTGLITDIFTMWLITIPLASMGAFVLGWSPVTVIIIIKFNIVLEAFVGIWRIQTMKWVKNFAVRQ